MAWVFRVILVCGMDFMVIFSRLLGGPDEANPRAVQLVLLIEFLFFDE